MQARDKIRVIKGEHAGRIGEVIGKYQAQGLERLRDEDFSGLWYIEFEDGNQDIIQEALMEVIEPE